MAQESHMSVLVLVIMIDHCFFAWKSLTRYLCSLCPWCLIHCCIATLISPYGLNKGWQAVLSMINGTGEPCQCLFWLSFGRKSWLSSKKFDKIFVFSVPMVPDPLQHSPFDFSIWTQQRLTSSAIHDPWHRRAICQCLFWLSFGKKSWIIASLLEKVWQDICDLCAHGAWSTAA